MTCSHMAPTMNIMRNALSTGTTAAVKAAMMSRSEPSRPKSLITRKARNDLQGIRQAVRGIKGQTPTAGFKERESNHYSNLIQRARAFPFALDLTALFVDT